MRRLREYCCFILLILTVIGAIRILRRDDPVITIRDTIEIGGVEKDKVCFVNFELKNRSWSDVTIVGSQTDCSCSVVNDLPKTISAGQSVSLQIEFRSGKPETENDVERTVFVYTSDGKVVGPLKFRYRVFEEKS